jgi:asparagine synthase (glutamine-hydrolysing)
MCGINGIFVYGDARPIDRIELKRTRDYMQLRGPDSFGDWVSQCQRVGFGHRRLSIIDLSDAAAQPMSGPDGNSMVTFNGEIYNYRELRRDLEGKGYVFRTNSDTEVLLHLYADRGTEMVHDLRGMFAFAIWDNLQKRLFLARDPYGIKPLYYADNGTTFRFASQLKALMASNAVPSDVDNAGLVGFYIWGSIPEPFTIRKHVKLLPAGSTLVLSFNKVGAPVEYHSIASAFCVTESTNRWAKDEEGQIEEIRDALLDSVKCHLVGDVPVGLFLSSGIDSLALLELMRDTGQKDIQSITLSFDNFIGTPSDETPLATKIANHYNLRHTNRVVTKDEFTEDIPNIMSAMDQPTTDGVNTWFVSKAASEIGLKVAVSGVGGDELFSGYPTFRDIPRWVSMNAPLSKVPGLGKLSRSVLAVFMARLGMHPKGASMLELGGGYNGAYMLHRGLFMPSELTKLLGPDIANDGLKRLVPFGLMTKALGPEPHTAVAKISTLESALYLRNQLLRDTDWASMAHSVEVRTPLVDSQLLARLAPIASISPPKLTKAALATSPSSPLPKGVIERPKTGFSVPIADWVDDFISSSSIAEDNRKIEKEIPSRKWAKKIIKEYL